MTQSSSSSAPVPTFSSTSSSSTKDRSPIRPTPVETIVIDADEEVTDKKTTILSTTPELAFRAKDYVGVLCEDRTEKYWVAQLQSNVTVRHVNQPGSSVSVHWLNRLNKSRDVYYFYGVVEEIPVASILLCLHLQKLPQNTLRLPPDQRALLMRELDQIGSNFEAPPQEIKKRKPPKKKTPSSKRQSKLPKARKRAAFVPRRPSVSLAALQQAGDRPIRERRAPRRFIETDEEKSDEENEKKPQLAEKTSKPKPTVPVLESTTPCVDSSSSTSTKVERKRPRSSLNVGLMPARALDLTSSTSCETLPPMKKIKPTTPLPKELNTHLGDTESTAKEFVLAIKEQNMSLIQSILASSIGKLHSLFVKWSFHQPQTCLDYAVRQNNVKLVESILHRCTQPLVHGYPPDFSFASTSAVLDVSFSSCVSKFRRAGQASPYMKDASLLNVLMQDLTDGRYQGLTLTQAREQAVETALDMSEELSVQMWETLVQDQWIDFYQVAMEGAMHSGQYMAIASMLQQLEKQKVLQLSPLGHALLESRTQVEFNEKLKQEEVVPSHSSLMQKLESSANLRLLFVCILHPSEEVISTLFELLLPGDYTVGDNHGWKLVHYTAVARSSFAFDLAFSYHELNLQDPVKDGKTPLILAAYYGRIATVHAICKAFRETCHKLSSKQSNKDRYDAECFDFFTTCDNAGYTVLHYALLRGHVQVVQYLLQTYPQVFQKILCDVKLPTKANFFMTAVQSPEVESLELILQHVKKNCAEEPTTFVDLLNEQDKSGKSALMYAMMNGNAQMATLLINAGAQFGVCDVAMNSVVHYAAAYGFYECLTTLVEALVARATLLTGSRASLLLQLLTASNTSEQTPFAIALLKGRVECAEYLFRMICSLSRKNADFTVGKSPLVHYLAETLRPQFHFIEAILTNPLVNVNARGMHKNTVLHVLMQRSYPEHVLTYVKRFVQLLLVHVNCDPLALNDMKQTPLMVSLQYRQLDLAKLLPLSSSQVDHFGQNVFHYAKYVLQDPASVPLLTKVLEGFPEAERDRLLTAPDKYGFPPLHACIYHLVKSNPEKPDYALVKLLYQHTPNMLTLVVHPSKELLPKDPTAYDHNSILHFVAQMPQVLEQVISLDWNAQEKICPALLDQFNSKGQTPLHLAVEFGNDVSVKTLINCGANVNLAMSKSPKLTPLHLACHHGHVEIVERLRDAGADINAVDEFLRTPVHVAIEARHSLPQEYKVHATRSSEMQNSKPSHVQWWRIQRHPKTKTLDRTQFHPEVADVLEIAYQKQQARFHGMKKETPHRMDLNTYRASVEFWRKQSHVIPLKTPEGGEYELDVIKMVQTNLQTQQVAELKRYENPMAKLPIMSTATNLMQLLLAEPRLGLRKRDVYGRTVLHLAAGKRDIALVHRLLQLDVVVDAIDHVNRTPLHYAINHAPTHRYQTDVEEMLLRAGANPLAVDKYGFNCFHHTLQKVEVSFVSPVPLSMSERIHTSNISPPNQFIRAFDPVQGIALLTRHLPAQENLCLNQATLKGYTPLHLAASNGAIASAIHLIQKGASLQVFNELQNSPLATALIARQEEAARTLICLGADVQVKVYRPEGTSCSMFQYAMYLQWHEIGHVLLDLGNFPIAQALQELAATGNLQYLLEFGTSLPLASSSALTATTSSNQTLLHLLALFSQQYDPTTLESVMTLLVQKHGIPVDAVDSDGYQACHYAAANGHLRFCQYLYEQGYPVGSVVSEKKESCWHCAGRAGQMPILQWLRQIGAPMHHVTASGANMLCLLLEGGLETLEMMPSHAQEPFFTNFLAKVELCLRFGSRVNLLFRPRKCFRIRDVTIAEISPLIRILHCPERLPRRKLLLLWLEHATCDVDFVDSEGFNPLMHAVSLNALEDLVTLCSHGSNVSKALAQQTFRHQWSLLHLVLHPLAIGMYENHVMLNYLLQHKAPIELKDDTGRSPFESSPSSSPEEQLLLPCVRARNPEQVHAFARAFAIELCGNPSIGIGCKLPPIFPFGPMADIKVRERSTLHMYNHDVYHFFVSQVHVREKQLRQECLAVQLQYDPEAAVYHLMQLHSTGASIAALYHAQSSPQKLQAQTFASLENATRAFEASFRQYTNLKWSEKWRVYEHAKNQSRGIWWNLNCKSMRLDSSCLCEYFGAQAEAASECDTWLTSFLNPSELGHQLEEIGVNRDLMPLLRLERSLLCQAKEKLAYLEQHKEESQEKKLECSAEYYNLVPLAKHLQQADIGHVRVQAELERIRGLNGIARAMEFFQASCRLQHKEMPHASLGKCCQEILGIQLAPVDASEFISQWVHECWQHRRSQTLKYQIDRIYAVSQAKNANVDKKTRQLMLWHGARKSQVLSLLNSHAQKDEQASVFGDCVDYAVSQETQDDTIVIFLYQVASPSHRNIRYGRYFPSPERSITLKDRRVLPSAHLIDGVDELDGFCWGIALPCYFARQALTEKDAKHPLEKWATWIRHWQLNFWLTKLFSWEFHQVGSQHALGSDVVDEDELLQIFQYAQDRPSCPNVSIQVCAREKSELGDLQTASGILTIDYLDQESRTQRFSCTLIRQQIAKTKNPNSATIPDTRPLLSKLKRRRKSKGNDAKACKNFQEESWNVTKEQMVELRRGYNEYYLPSSAQAQVKYIVELRREEKEAEADGRANEYII